MHQLPVDNLIPDILERLASGRDVLLRAEPGAGKTTRVPPALLETPWAADKKILVAEPRRLAARLAARRVAEERGERLGEGVGYAVRFETVASAHTRLTYVTAGVLLRHLSAQPNVDGIAAIVLDEFHERSVAIDLCLALALDAKRRHRSNLRLVLMSATLDPVALLAHMPEAILIDCPGRCYPLTIWHEPQADDRPVDKKVLSGCRQLVRDNVSGDILVFLPGVREIQQSATALEGLAEETNTRVLPLHAELPLEEQVRAVRPAEERKIVLSTNVAESSVTVPGVVAVIDCGTARVAQWSPWSGISRLRVAKISKAAATQRAGRAGRTGPGRVLRLYTECDLARRAEQDAPEIHRADLSEYMLLLLAAGLGSPHHQLPWLDPPPASSVQATALLLERLDAVDADGQITEIGARMAALPLPPRLARLFVEGCRRGVAREAMEICALLSERDIRIRLPPCSPSSLRSDGFTGPSDALELLDRLNEARLARHRPHSLRTAQLHPQRVNAVERTILQLRNHMTTEAAPPPKTDADYEKAILLSLMRAFPDRVARRRRPGQNELTLSNGDGAILSDDSVVRRAPFLIAIDLDDRSPSVKGRPLVRVASSIEADWLLDEWPERLCASSHMVLNPGLQRVERISRITYGSIVLDESQKAAKPCPEASALLAAAALEPNGLGQSQRRDISQWFARLRLLAENCSDLRLPDSTPILLQNALAAASAGLTTLNELRGISIISHLERTLSPQHCKRLREWTPTEIAISGRRKMRINYSDEQPPWVESKMQDFFGLREGPTLCNGRVPIVVHLLAPNQRAVQVTRDLGGFWDRHYPDLRRQLMRRYPKHDWPEDPRTASPPPLRPKRF